MRFIRGRALMNFYYQLTRYWTLHIFILRLSVWPILGLAGEAASPPVNFTPTFWRGWYLPIVCIFLVLQGALQHLGYLLALDS